MMERLKTWDVRTQTHSSTDRNLRHAFYELDRLKDKLGLSDAIVEKTAYICRKAQERMLIRGRTNRNFVCLQYTLLAGNWELQEP